MDDMIRILIVGANGFIGKNLIKYFNKQNGSQTKKYKVYALMRNFPESDIPLGEVECCYICDATDSFAIQRILLERKINYVIQVAGVSTVADAISAPDNTYDNNIRITGAICSACAECEKIRGILLASTSLVYHGARNKKLFKEDDMIDARYLTPYVKSKYFSEMRAWDYQKLPIVIMRLANIYGPDDRQKRLISCTIERLLREEVPDIYIDSKTGESAKVDYLYIEDLMEAMGRIIDSIETGDVHMEQTGCSVFNVGSGTTCSVEDIVNTLIDIFGLHVQPRHIRMIGIDSNYPMMDLHKMETVFGFRAKTPLSDGLTRTAKEWRKYQFNERS